MKTLANFETSSSAPLPGLSNNRKSAGIKRPARVLFVHTSLPGGDRSLFNVLRNLDPGRFRTTLFLLKPECVNADEIAGSTDLIMGGRRAGRIRYALPGLLRNLIALAASHDIVVGALELDSTYLAWLAAKINRKPVIGWVRTTLEGYLNYKQKWHVPLLRAIYPRLDRVVFVNRHAASSIEKLAHLRHSQVRVISNSLDPQAVETRQKTTPSWNGMRANQPVVMAVGRLNPEKGFDLLIRAHHRLRNRGVDHLLVIMGKGPLRDDLAALARRLEVADTVVMPGYFVNPYTAMKEATVFALSSHVEGFPSVLLEALYLGVPIVATRCPSGPEEVLDNGRCGVLVPPNDEIALAEAIGDLLQDPVKRSRLIAEGRDRIREFYAQNIASVWQGMFDELLTRAKA